jgi:hypothetical protein
MTDMLNKEVDVYIAFLLSLYYDTHIRRQQRRNRVYGVYPRHRKNVSGV